VREGAMVIVVETRDEAFSTHGGRSDAA
jgi:hypothetical protein